MIHLTHETRELPAIQPPLPANDRGTSVFAALEQRKTTRTFSATPLPIQLLSNLLSAACGANRKTAHLESLEGPPLRPRDSRHDSITATTPASRNALD